MKVAGLCTRPSQCPCVYTHDAAMTVSCEDQEDEIDHYNAQILNGWNGESDDDNDDEGDDENVEEGG